MSSTTTPTWRRIQQECARVETEKAVDGTFCDWLDRLAAQPPIVADSNAGFGEMLTGVR